MQWQLKPQKTEELTYLQANKEETTYRVRYLEFSNYSVFSGAKLRNKVPLVYLDCKLEKGRYMVDWFST